MSDFDQTLQATLASLKISVDKRRSELDAMLAGSPPTITCSIHGTARELSRELSARAGLSAYGPCQICRNERQEDALVERLKRAGVPLNLQKATIQNWKPESASDEAHLVQVRSFIQAKRGFLLMLGDLGTGKSHLAAAITRYFSDPMFIKQSELLRRLRHTYRDKAARDPVDDAQDSGLLVLDEVGLSAGGRDELPMLHDILDHRYNERKPTVLTGNITLEQMQVVVGQRMADRLRESAFAVLMFGGDSRRRDARDRYFEVED